MRTCLCLRSLRLETSMACKKLRKKKNISLMSGSGWRHRERLVQVFRCKACRAQGKGSRKRLCQRRVSFPSPKDVKSVMFVVCLFERHFCFQDLCFLCNSDKVRLIGSGAIMKQASSVMIQCWTGKCSTTCSLQALDAVEILAEYGPPSQILQEKSFVEL